MISRLNGCTWPSCTPDMSLDYWPWSVCLAQLRRSRSAALEELIATVEEYKGSLEEQDADLLPARACIETGGGT